jgi:hypothetical protein
MISHSMHVSNTLVSYCFSNKADLATQFERLLRETPDEAAKRITTSFLVPLTPGQEDVIDNAISGMGSKTKVLNAIQGTEIPFSTRVWNGFNLKCG